jgi:hypothetical protein
MNAIINSADVIAQTTSGTDRIRASVIIFGILNGQPPAEPRRRLKANGCISTV